MMNSSLINNSSKENEYEEIYIPVPWGHIAAKWWGPRNVQPILAVHGWQDNCGSFDNLAPLLTAKGYSLLCIDLPGHGHSSHLPNGVQYYIFWDGIHYVRRIVQYYQWKSVTIIGHSLGGAIAFLYAASYPEEVEKIISIDIVSPSVRCPKKFCSAVGPAIDKFLSYEKPSPNSIPNYSYEEMLETLLFAHNGSITKESGEILLKRGMKPKDDGSYNFTRDPRLKCAAAGFISLEPSIEFAARITCKVLNIKASKGHFRSEVPEHYDLVLDKIEENAKKLIRHTVEGTHHLHLNDGASVSDIIHNFLKET